MRKPLIVVLVWAVIVLTITACASDSAASKREEKEEPKVLTDEVKANDEASKEKTKKEEKEKEAEEKKKNQLEFERLEHVRGIYVTGQSAGGERFDTLLDLIDNTDLNAMVIDIKDDFGNITYEPDEKSDFASFGKPYIKDPRKLLKILQKNDVYPIARVVVFKDSVFAEENEDMTFLSGKQIWRNGNDEAFVSPFQKKVWEHNLAIAKDAAEMGFQEIQFDYVRFPEGFENRADELSYDKGDYADIEDDVEARVQAVTDFVIYAEEELREYDVDVSVDIFGYTAVVDNAPGIGQDLVKIGEHIDVISSMIYPSHWGEGSLGIAKPDLEPYDVMHEYVAKEKEKLFQMDDPPTSRPWIQDFTASWLGSGNYKAYGKEEVEAQIRGLNEAGIDEYLLWNASNNYTDNVNYKPSLDNDVIKAIKKEDKALRGEIEKEQKEENKDKANEKLETAEKEDDKENQEKTQAKQGDS